MADQRFDVIGDVLFIGQCARRTLVMTGVFFDEPIAQIRNCGVSGGAAVAQNLDIDAVAYLTKETLCFPPCRLDGPWRPGLANRQPALAPAGANAQLEDLAFGLAAATKAAWIGIPVVSPGFKVSILRLVRRVALRAGMVRFAEDYSEGPSKDF